MIANNYRIESATLRNVGVFKETVIEFPQSPDPKKAEIHLFTGPNGSGKSTLLYALAGMFNDTGNLKRISMERYRKDKSIPINITITPPPQGGEGSPAAFSYSGNRSMRSIPLRGIQEIRPDPFENALSFDKSIRPELFAQWIANMEAKQAFAFKKGMQEQERRYAGALEQVYLAVEAITGEKIRFELKPEVWEVSAEFRGDLLEFDVLPDGLKSIISWIGDLLMRLERIPWLDIPWQEERALLNQPIILFLDEIDIHLHPKWQRRILPAVQKLFPNAQIFASTHSPFVINSVKDAWVYRLPGENGVVEAMPSAAGQSYMAVLDEIFQVTEEFDVETEKDFVRLYELKDRIILKKEWGQIPEFQKLAHQLANRGEEVSNIVNSELRQLKRLHQQEISA